MRRAGVSYVGSLGLVANIRWNHRQDLEAALCFRICNKLTALTAHFTWLSAVIRRFTKLQLELSVARDTGGEEEV